MSKCKRARSAKTRSASKVRVEADPQANCPPSSNAGDFETGAGACPAARTGGRHNRHRHAPATFRDRYEEALRRSIAEDAKGAAARKGASATPARKRA